MSQATMPQPTTGLGAPAEPRAGSEFAPLLKAVKGQGLLDRRTSWYATRIAVNLLALAATITAMVLDRRHLVDPAARPPALRVLGPQRLLRARRGPRPDHPGQGRGPGHRPAPQRPPARHELRLVERQAQPPPRQPEPHGQGPRRRRRRPRVDPAPGRAARKGFARWLTRNQARLFFPMLLLEGIALKVYGFQDLKRQPPRERAVEAPLLIAHLAGYATLLLTVMSPGKALVFALVHHALFGLHLGMTLRPQPQGHGDARPGRRRGLGLGPSGRSRS